MRRSSGEGGSATVEFVWCSLLLLVPFVYVLLAVFDTQRAAYAVSTASKAAARAYLQAADPDEAQARARQAARIALDDQDVDAQVEVSCLPSASDCLQPGSSVRVVVRTVQPLPLTPPALGPQLGGIAVDSEHTEPFGSYRETR
ncbi:MAG: pilus assembly protein [Aeromicrobium erythreum]